MCLVVTPCTDLQTLYFSDCPFWKTTKTRTIRTVTPRPSCWTATRVGSPWATLKRNSARSRPPCWARPKVRWVLFFSPTVIQIVYSSSSIEINNNRCFSQENYFDWEPYWNPHNDTYTARRICSNWLKTRFVSPPPKTGPDIRRCWPSPSNWDYKYVVVFFFFLLSSAQTHLYLL